VATDSASASPQTPAAGEEHAFSCAIAATLIARVRNASGDDGVRRLLAEAGSRHSVDYLTDIGNWISMDDMLALWRAGEVVTCDPSFTRHVGEDAVRVLGSSSTATTLRGLGSPEELMRRVGVASHRFSVASRLETVEARPGYAEILAYAEPGFVRERMHCDWTAGLLSQSTALFGLPPARVDHDACQTLGAPECRYRVTWELAAAADEADATQVAILRKQLDAMSERLQNVFETAADLIAAGSLDETLARITDRAAHQVRAPKHLLAVRPSAGSEQLLFHSGLGEDEARAIATRVLDPAAADLPEHWCVAAVRSHRSDYGRLVAIYQDGAQFFPQERELLELYGRYAATALDSATALREAGTLLELARQLAEAGTSQDVARRLAEAVPSVLDCDRVTIYVWDEEEQVNVRTAVNVTDGSDPLGPASAAQSRPEDVPQLARWLEHPDPEPYFIDIDTSAVRDPLQEVGVVASIAVPIATAQRFLGCLLVSVRRDATRLAPSPELRGRLLGVAAHAVTALENGRLVDHITSQARHDRLTGLANRLAFGEDLAARSQTARTERSPLALFYVDLDRFKPVNDEFGHEVGDELLQGAAGRLLRCVRADDRVARLGGDEFAIIVAGIADQHRLAEMASRIERAFDQPFSIQGQTLRVGASVGQAAWPADVSDPEELLRRADAAMYGNKHARQSGSAPRARRDDDD